MFVSLFDGNEAKVWLEKSVRVPHGAGKTVTVPCLHVDGSAGASQSGYHLWPAATGIVEYFCDEASGWSRLRNARNCLELGCGMGLPALCCAALRPEIDIVATDGEEQTLACLEQSIERAHEQGTVMGTVSTRCLSWEEKHTAEKVAKVANRRVK